MKNINKLQDQIFLDDKTFNIGIAWSGNKEYFLDSYRSIPFKYFENILKLKNINFYKLSKDRRDEDKNKYDKFSNIIDLGNKSLLEVAEYIKNLDLVISSDTSIIHLAGILNK